MIISLSGTHVTGLRIYRYLAYSIAPYIADASKIR